MPSPFPGMDPYIEMFAWEDFHSRLVTAVADALEVDLAERYIIRVERRIYVEIDSGEKVHRIPDISVADAGPSMDSFHKPTTDSNIAVVPVECNLPMSDEYRESYLVIRDEETNDIVTSLEVLSPNNKRRGSYGRSEYLKKRELVLRTSANLVEIDLLRGGDRLPMASPLPPGDYFAIISRESNRPRAEVYGWNLLDRIPNIKIPVLPNDEDITLDLQNTVDLVYRRSRYRRLNYAAELDPSLEETYIKPVGKLLSSVRST